MELNYIYISYKYIHLRIKVMVSLPLIPYAHAWTGQRAHMHTGGHGLLPVKAHATQQFRPCDRKQSMMGGVVCHTLTRYPAKSPPLLCFFFSDSMEQASKLVLHWKNRCSRMLGSSRANRFLLSRAYNLRCDKGQNRESYHAREVVILG